MKALTVRMLVRESHRIEPGQTVLVHAAGGGAGQILTAWARHLGATVIASVGSEEKAERARRAGASHVILYRKEDLAERVSEITGGAGVAAAYDSVGADTFAASLACLDYFGTLVSYGQASGPVPPFALSALAGKSLNVARPIVFHALRTRAMRDKAAEEVFEAFEAGIIRPIAPLILDLADAAEAHRIIEAGESPGGIVLIP
jgi:NADPH2:quinone reductase